ncbi:MAG: hydrolase [Deltaproteobacteria bacterium]|nr:hydrolase [Deltaproteobacteria bacterium]
MVKINGLREKGRNGSRDGAIRPDRSLGLIMSRLFWAGLFVMIFAGISAAQASRPILFVHGNGDSAALWHTTIWRFESNGYSPSLLFALDFKHPMAGNDDTKSQENRSNTTVQVNELRAKVSEIQTRTGQKQVILVGSSRGGYAIRNYIKNFGGAANVSQVVLCGTPNHGVQATSANLNNEFNGLGPFLQGLNAGEEVTPGVPFMTIRSDSNDKYAQPDGRFLGLPGKPTNVTHAGPELRGAKNVILPGLDHRETAFHPQAFKTILEFITGRQPETLEVIPQPQPDLNGLVSGWANGAPTNLPIIGAKVEIYEIDPSSGQRLGEPVHQRTTGEDGTWGPFTAKPTAYYEFVVTASGYPITHIYRTPFPRSSPYIHLRLKPLGDRDKVSGSLVTLTRPRGYLGHGRDTFLIDGKVPSGVNGGVPGTSEARQRFEPGPLRPIRVELNKEFLTVLTYPVDAGHIVIAEFHY